MSARNVLLATFWLALLVICGANVQHGALRRHDQLQPWQRSVLHHARHHHQHAAAHKLPHSKGANALQESPAAVATATASAAADAWQHAATQQLFKNSGERQATKPPVSKVSAPHNKSQHQHHHQLHHPLHHPLQQPQEQSHHQRVTTAAHAHHNYSQASLPFAPYAASAAPPPASTADISRQAKSMSDATLLNHFKATSNELQHAASSDTEDDYIDDEYDDEERAAAEHDDDYDDAEDERQLSSGTNRLGSVAHAPLTRVTRDHHRSSHYHGHGQQRHAYESPHQQHQQHQDYADDEPYNPAEQAGSGVPGDLTKQKIDELGTEEAVQQSHDKYMEEQRQYRQKTPAQLAAEHMNRMDSAVRCRRPLPRVVPVSDETSKVFRPSCTWLHRCGADTGCCHSTWEVCTNKSYEHVQVYVYVYSISTGRREIEVKTLENHTECHCVNNSYISRYKRSDAVKLPLLLSAAATGSRQLDPNELDDDYENESLCHCPTHFDVLTEETESPAGYWRHPSHGALRQGYQSCRCDCYSHNVPCQRLQRGKEGFAVDDRKCIAERRCRTPVCAHGEYSTQTGRCPRLRTHKHASTHHNYGIG